VSLAGSKGALVGVVTSSTTTPTGAHFALASLRTSLEADSGTPSAAPYELRAGRPVGRSNSFCVSLDCVDGI